MQTGKELELLFPPWPNVHLLGGCRLEPGRRVVAWELAAAHRAPATPDTRELLRRGNRDQDRSCVSSWSWTTQFSEAEVFVLLSLWLGADL